MSLAAIFAVVLFGAGVWYGRIQFRKDYMNMLDQEAEDIIHHINTGKRWTN